MNNSGTCQSVASRPTTEPMLPSSQSLRPIDLRTLAWGLLLFLATQLLFVGRPTINLEYAFIEAALSLAGHQPAERMAYFWSTQANPLGYPFLASLILRLLPMIEPLAIVRLLSVLGGVLLLVSAADLLRYLPGTTAASERWTLLLLACHPMIWLYTNSATADILPTGLMLAAIACCCRGRTRVRWHFPGIALFSLACIVKFNCALMGGGLAFILLADALAKQKTLARNAAWLLAYALSAIGVLVIYFLWIYRNYGIIFLPEHFKTILTFERSGTQRLMAFVLYLDFLVLFAGPLALVLLSSLFLKGRKRFWLGLSVLFGTFAVTMVFFRAVPTIGEMDFGGLGELLPPVVLLMVYAAGLWMVFLLAFSLIDAIRDEHRRGFVALLLAISVPYLLVSAMTRPAQRYLILVLPFFLIWLVHMAWQLKPRTARTLMVSASGLFVGLSMLGILYLNAQAYAADRIGQWIVRNQLVEQTDPGILANHIGHLFALKAPANPTCRLEVWPRGDKALHTPIVHEEPVFVGPFLVKRFVLVASSADDHSGLLSR